VLFYNKKRHQLFTIRQQVEDEDDEDCGETATPVSDKIEIHYDEEINERLLKVREDRIQQMIRQKQDPMNDFIIKQKEILWFPCTLGLTIRAFRDNEICFNNIEKKRSRCPVSAIG
jgi:hypothetical protein